jgi:hypothetical protein
MKDWRIPSHGIFDAKIINVSLEFYVSEEMISKTESH